MRVLSESRLAASASWSKKAVSSSSDWNAVRFGRLATAIARSTAEASGGKLTGTLGSVRLQAASRVRAKSVLTGRTDSSYERLPQTISVDV